MTSSTSSIDFDEINRASLARCLELLSARVPCGQVRNNEYVAAGIHGGDGDSFSFNMITGRWADFATTDHRGGDFISLVAAQESVSQPEAARIVAEIIGYDISGGNVRRPVHRLESVRTQNAPQEKKRTLADPPKPGEINFMIPLPDGSGTCIHRKNGSGLGKTMKWIGPDGCYGLDGRPLETLPLYGWEQLPEDKTAPVIVCEGETATDALLRKGISAVGTVCGAASIPSDDSLKPLLRRPIFLWPDNDDPGRKHMTSIAETLQKLEHLDIRMIDWKDAPDKGDAWDFCQQEAWPDELSSLMDDARPFTTTTSTDTTSNGVPKRAICPRSALQYLTEDIPEPPPLIEGILPALCVLLIYGMEKAGKTWLALQLAFLLITGGDFFGFKIHGKHRVMLISPEGADHQLKKRLQGALPYVANLDDKALERLFMVSTLGGLKIDTEEGERIILQWAKDFGVDVVILDSIYRFTSKGSENSHDDAKPIQDMIDRLKAAGLTVIVVHHSRKPGDTDRGTAEIRGAGWGPYSDAILKLSKKTPGKYTLGFTLRHYEEPEEFVLKRNGPLFALPGPDEWEITPSDALDILKSHNGRIEGKAVFVQLIREAFPEASERAVNRAIDEAEKEQRILSCKQTGKRGSGRTYYIPKNGEAVND